MRRHQQQSGQALIATLVIMLFVFAMAGAIALAASSLLNRQNTTRNALDGDLRAGDAIAAAVAHVAGKGVAASAVCHPYPDSPETLTNPLPRGYVSSVSCLRMDEVATPQVLTSVLIPWNSACATPTVQLPSRNRVWVFFSALAGAGLRAWVDGAAGCSSSPQGKVECQFSQTTGRGVALVAMDCDLAEVTGNSFLHVWNPLSSPTAARLANNATPAAGGNGANGNGNGGGNNGRSAAAAPVDTSGSIYELAATTGLGSPLYEEGAVFVSRDGKETALVAEGSL
jgi:hypothetical protein